MRLIAFSVYRGQMINQDPETEPTGEVIYAVNAERMFAYDHWISVEAF